ncbi:IncP-type conjugal transfer protein TrbI [Brucella intermedia]|uniref:IncP-type conjugal transfer protein TrbI n=1 Tax=Brucella intermedia TaxID=94625 RepID=UPI002362166C|nr:IncP-type conjugal transfer protein TrbI [Brucella intermedia]
MVQSLKLGGAANGEAGSGIRRVNRLPIIAGIAGAVVVIAIVFFGLMNRGPLFLSDPGLDASSSSPASTFADQIKRGVSDGIIGEPQQTQTFQPSPTETKDETVADPFTPQPIHYRETQPYPESEDVWRARLEREHREQYLRERHRQQMARLQADNAARDAPLAIDRSKLDSRAGESGAPFRTGESLTTASSSTGATSDLYAAALRKGLSSQNVDPNAQMAKEEFFNSDLKKLGYLPNGVIPQQSPYELKRGSVIPATLITGINSDLPGCITAQVSQHVFDSATGHRLLIPQGTRLLGRYDSKVSFGQSRVLVIWTDLIFPNGSTLQIGGMAGTDAEGYGGFNDKVDRKWLQTFGSAILTAVIGTGTDMAIPHDRNALGSASSAEDAARRSFADTFGRLADRTIQRNMDVQPTLAIRPGYKFNILVDQDIIFPGVYR